MTDQVGSIIEMKQEDPSFDTRFEFTIDGKTEKYSVWIDPDPNKNKVYRLTPSENAQTTNTISNPDSKPSFSSSTTKSSDFKPKGMVDGNSHDCVLLEEYKKMKFPIVALTTKDKSPNNYMIMNNGKMEIWIWIGTYKYFNQ